MMPGTAAWATGAVQRRLLLCTTAASGPGRPGPVGPYSSADPAAAGGVAAGGAYNATADDMQDAVSSQAGGGAGGAGSGDAGSGVDNPEMVMALQARLSTIVPCWPMYH
jgi:hypothetical protein